MCHQTVSLTARHLETNGVPTVVVGSARDIVEQCAVPRFLFVDFPLGNPMGAPFDRAMQRQIAEMAVRLLEDAPGPETTVRAPFDWPGDPEWRGVYNRVTPETAEALRREGERRKARRSELPKRDL